MRVVDWYFDFVSPYAYFGLLRLGELPPVVTPRYHPVLFAGLLGHWGQRGPAEIGPKRVWTYRSCVWQAERAGVPFRFPAAHPFNPLPYLRLALAADCRAEAVAAIFRALWTTGVDPADPAVVEALAASLAVEPSALARPELKQFLRANTERAAAKGVFGVPTLLIDGQPFWGADATAFALAYLADSGLLERGELARVSELPVGAARRID